MKKLILILSLFFCFIAPSFAQTRLTVEGSAKLYPIAVPVLCAPGGFTDGAKEISEVIARDLELSGYFDVLNPGSYIETPGKCNLKDFAFSDWTVLGVDGLVKGQIENHGGSIKVQLYLHDVQIQKLELAKEYNGDISQIRAIAHKFSNEILKYFTGEFGPFGTKIVYSQRVGRFKELFIMDLDGADQRQLTDDKGLAMSAAWHPKGEHIIFTNFRNQQPDLFAINPFNKKYVRLTRSIEQELGGKYTPDGQRILLAESQGQKSDLVFLSDKGKSLSRLTRNYSSIDVSPDFSPDGSEVIFTSNRSGNPQIYRMNIDGSNIRRVSYVSSNYCTSPVWSPKGNKIAFVCRSENKHHIFVTNPDGTVPVQLTVRGSNEDPSWSPDGRYLVFATTAFNGIYNLALIRLDGVNLTQMTNSRAGSYDPAWSPWLY